MSSVQVTSDKQPSKQRQLRPQDATWPSVGYVGVPGMRLAMGGCSHQTVYTYIREGLLPPMIDIGIGRRGWPVDVARQAIVELPGKIAARKARRKAS